MYKVVVVGTDGSPTAEKAVEMAAGLARPLGAHLHIVTAYKAGVSGIAGASGVALVDSGAGHAVAEEVSASRRLCARHNWPLIDVTRRSIEETAAAVLALLTERRRHLAS